MCSNRKYNTADICSDEELLLHLKLNLTDLFVFVHIDALQLAEANEVGAHQNPQLLSFLLSLLSVSAVTLMLHSHP